MGTQRFTEHDFNCLMSLAATYANHSKYSLARECAWAAADVATGLAHPGMQHAVNVMLRAIAMHEGSQVPASGVRS